MGDAEGGVWSGIAEVPGELDSGDLDLEGGGGGSGVAGGRPEALGLEGEGGEEEAKGGEGEILDAPEVGWFGAAPGEEASEEDEVGEGEESQGDPEIEEKVAIECETVDAGVSG